MVRELSPGLQEIAIKEINEDPNKRDELLKHLREWVQNHASLKPRVVDDQWILAFLRGCKFNLEKTKEKMEQYYAAKVTFPHLTTYEDPFSPRIQTILDANAILVLPQAENSTDAVLMLSSFGGFDPSISDFDDYLTVCFMVMTVLMIESDNFIISGLKSVSNLENFPYRVFYKFTPSYLKAIQMTMMKAFPLRTKLLCCIYNSFFITILYRLFKSLMPKKIAERFMLVRRDNIDDIYQHIPRHLLPKDYGGDNGTIEEIGRHWKKKIESYADWFKAENSYYNNNNDC